MLSKLIRLITGTPAQPELSSADIAGELEGIRDISRIMSICTSIPEGELPPRMASARASLVQIALARISSIKSRLRGNEHLQSVHFAQSLITTNVEGGNILGYLGQAPVSVNHYLDCMKANLAEQAMMINREPSLENLFSIDLNVVYAIVKAVGWSETIAYLEGLWRDGWIHWTQAYYNLYSVLVFCQLCEFVPEKFKTADEFAGVVLGIRRVVYQTGEHDEQIKHYFQQKVTRMLADARSQSQNLSEWIRRLFDVIPYCTVFGFLLHAAYTDSEEIESGELYKEYRFNEENRTDIRTVLGNPYLTIGSNISESISTNGSKDRLIKALKYMQKGRVLIPQSYLNGMISRLEEFPHNLEQLRNEIESTFDEQLSAAQQEAYKIMYPALQSKERGFRNPLPESVAVQSIVNGLAAAAQTLRHSFDTSQNFSLLTNRYAIPAIININVNSDETMQSVTINVSPVEESVLVTSNIMNLDDLSDIDWEGQTEELINVWIDAIDAARWYLKNSYEKLSSVRLSLTLPSFHWTALLIFDLHKGLTINAVHLLPSIELSTLTADDQSKFMAIGLLLFGAIFEHQEFAKKKFLVEKAEVKIVV